MQAYQIEKNIVPEKFTIGTIAVNVLKTISWLVLMGVGGFICCMPWLAASFGLVLPSIFAGFTFPAMLALGLTIGVPSLMMTVAAALNIFHKRGVAKLIKNIASITMALAALAIGVLLFAAPGLPIISAFAGMIGGLGSFGVLLTKISLITFSVCKGLDVVWECFTGSKSRILYGAIGNDVNKPVDQSDNAVIHALISAFLNLPKALRNLAIILLGVVVCCKISLAVGLIFAIPFGLKLVANFLDKNGNKWAHRIAKLLDNAVRVTFGAALLYTGILFLQPAVLLGFLGKLSFVAAAFPGVIGLAAGISLIVFGALMLFKAVTDVICGDKEKFKQGVREITTSPRKSIRNRLAKLLDDVLDVQNEENKIKINGIVGEITETQSIEMADMTGKD